MSFINSLTQFVPGTKALASEINTNFETIRQANNEHHTKINMLESDINNIQTADSENIVDIQTYGAFCDDTTDDTAVVQSILDEGKNPFIPANKKVKITSTLVMKYAGQRILGADSYTSVLRWYGSPDGLMLSASYNNIRIENLKLDGLDVSGVSGINLARDRNTFNQIIRNVRIWGCKNRGIQGYDSDNPTYFSSDCYIEKTQFSYCGAGVAFKTALHNLNSCVFDNCVEALQAYSGSKINIKGCAFSLNDYDVKYNSCELLFCGAKFEKSKQKTFSAFSGSAQNLSLLVINGCHFHTQTSGLYAIDLSEVTTSGTFVFSGNSFADDSSTKNILLSSYVNNFVSDNYGMGTAKSSDNGLRNDNKVKISTLDYIAETGLNNYFGNPVYVYPPDNFSSMILQSIKLNTSGAFLSGEIITFNIETFFYDSGTTKTYEKQISSLSSYWLDQSEIASLLKNNTYLKSIKIKIRSNKTSSSVIATTTPYFYSV